MAFERMFIQAGASKVEAAGEKKSKRGFWRRVQEGSLGRAAAAHQFPGCKSHGDP